MKEKLNILLSATKRFKSSALSVLLVIALLLVPLTGCGGNKEPEDTSSVSSEYNSESESESASESEQDSTGETTSETESESTSTSETESETESESESESETEIKKPDTGNKPDNNVGNTENNDKTDKDKTDKDNTDNNNTGNNNNTGDSNTGNNDNTGDNNTGNNDNTGDSNTGNTGNTGDSNTGDNDNTGSQTGGNNTSKDLNTPGISLSDIPAYSKDYYIVLNNNIPHFSTDNLATDCYEYYSELDSLGRCGVAYACLGTDLLPTEDRGSISSVKPTGWHTTSYTCVPGQSLYNRSHLIAFSLAGENANKKNLISGTQHLNQIEMQKFESQVLDYIKETGNHVLYRVTPFFEGNNLIATGVQMEGWSIEDNGEDICFNVFIYNVQDGITIDYATGESYETNQDDNTSSDTPENAQYVVNGNNGKIHKISCGNASGLTNPIYCETLEEAEAESAKIKGSAQYAGCCMG
ncbi:MAG: DNA/RNA non-specific endonuclease [Agathobacter sp.]|nr:DNA/RNA non-specific endonuclease [Agathobacter sp.]